MKTNVSSAVDFLIKFSGDNLIALTSIIPDGKATTKTFASSERDEMRKFIEVRNQKENIYYSVNPVKGQLNKKASKADIKEFAWLHVDIDPDEGIGLEEAREQISSRLEGSPLKPTAILDSGNGYQAFWKLKKPIPVNGNVECLEKENRRLETYFKADFCHNIDRVMRVPGTLNHPNKKKVRLGRKVSKARLIHFNNDAYSIDDLSVFGDQSKSKPSKAKMDYKVEAIDEEATREKFEALCKTDPDIKKRWDGDSTGLEDASGSGFDMALISLLKRRGFSFSETKLILHDYPYGKGFDMDDRYFVHTWEKAEDPPIYISSILEESGISRITEEAEPEVMIRALRKAVKLSGELPLVEVGFLRSKIQNILKKAKVSKPADIVQSAFPKIKQEEEDVEVISFLQDTEPYDGEVQGAELLNEIETIISRYVLVDKQSLTAISLWIVHAWCLEAFYLSPFLRIMSPTKGCGKTTLLMLISDMLPKCLLTANFTPAVMFRLIHKFEASIGIDEADGAFKDNPELISLVNASYTRGTAQVPRCNAETNEPEMFSVWGAKVICGIGKLPPTTEDRSIAVQLKKKKTAEKLDKFRFDKLGAYGELKSKLRRFSEDNIRALKEASDPEIPELLGDRPADNWRQLISIADFVDGGWPDKARTAALALNACQGDEELLVHLLRDIRSVFNLQETGTTKISSTRLTNELIEIEGSPWENLSGKYNDALTTNKMARMLAPLSIKSKKFRFGEDTWQGYKLSHFEDAFDRYLLKEDGSNEDTEWDYAFGEPYAIYDVEPQDVQFSIIP